MFGFINFMKRVTSELTDLIKGVTVMLTHALGAVLVFVKIRVALQTI